MKTCLIRLISLSSDKISDVSPCFTFTSHFHPKKWYGPWIHPCSLESNSWYCAGVTDFDFLTNSNPKKYFILSSYCKIVSEILNKKSQIFLPDLEHLMIFLKIWIEQKWKNWKLVWKEVCYVVNRCEGFGWRWLVFGFESVKILEQRSGFGSDRSDKPADYLILAKNWQKGLEKRFNRHAESNQLFI